MAVASRLAVARVAPDGGAAGRRRRRRGRPVVAVPTAGRGRGGAVAASPPTEEAVQTTEPLTMEDLVAYLVSGCKPKENWRISLEPGGQFELSGAPLETLHQTCAEVNSHLYQVKAVGEEMRIGFLGIGFQPKWALSDIPIMPKGRYEIMRNYMPKVGSLGLDMMFRTCTVQIATAIFANSPFKEGKPNGYLSLRSHIWTDTDNNRSGMLPFVFDDSFGFERYVDYALDVPMYFDFMVGKLPQAPGELPTLNDWENHLTTIFPEVRLKRYLEMRGADGGPWRRLCALPAFWVGLLYDEESLQSISDMTSDWTNEEREMLRRKTPFRDGYVRDLAEEILQLSKNGLERRGYKEVGFLREVDAVISSGVTPAERLLNLYETKWQRRVDPVFQELLY
uniref:Glutamate--cysteine ligase n=1 Tax=Oryza meridionalis TaxID=40149 RepID=A0A0E0DLH2_9ORYZ